MNNLIKLERYADGTTTYIDKTKIVGIENIDGQGYYIVYLLYHQLLVKPFDVEKVFS